MTATVNDPTGNEEPADYAVRLELGLRPVYWPDNTDGEKGRHPDQRGCPYWCWVGRQEEFDHQVNWKHPFSADHHMECVNIALSMYPGHYDSRGVSAATLGLGLEKIGQGGTTLSINRRSYPGGKEMRWEPDLIRLSMPEVRDLVAVLSYLLELHETDLA